MQGTTHQKVCVFFSGKTDKSNLIPDNASWYTAIHFESLMKASCKIVKK